MLALLQSDGESDVIVDEGDFVVFAVSAAVAALSTEILSDAASAGAAAASAAFAGVVEALDLAGAAAEFAGDGFSGIFAEFAGPLAFFAGDFGGDFAWDWHGHVAALEHEGAEDLAAGVAAEVQHGEGHIAVVFGGESERAAARGDDANKHVVAVERRGGVVTDDQVVLALAVDHQAFAFDDMQGFCPQRGQAACGQRRREQR